MSKCDSTLSDTSLRTSLQVEPVKEGSSENMLVMSQSLKVVLQRIFFAESRLTIVSNDSKEHQSVH